MYGETSTAQTWAVRALSLVTLVGAAIFFQTGFRQSDAVLVIAAIGFLGGPVVLGATGGFKPLATLAVVAFLLSSAISLAYGIDDIGLDLPECNSAREGFSPDPCGPRMAERALVGTFPALIIMMFGTIPAAVRLLWRRRSVGP